MTQTHTHSHLREAARQSTQRLSLALFLTLAFVLMEAVAGLLSNSLALLTDAAHNLTDVIALGLSWFALRVTARPANERKTYGYHRVGILVALVNSTTLVLISLGIFYEAYRRFLTPHEVQSGILIGVGLVAVVVNIVTAWLVHRGSESDLNLRSAFVHLMGDVLSTIGAVIAGVLIFFTGANWLDPLVSLLIGFLILHNAWGILRDAVDILLEAKPHDIDSGRLVQDLLQIEGVLGVHDLHIWSITQNMRTMSAHILTNDLSISDGADIHRKINVVVRRRYNIAHATLQLECVDCFPQSTLYCDFNGSYHLDKDSIAARQPASLQADD
jgi:cobalt-zinc-cadmium efflux system protein